ncbi:MAG: EAL domain-containing response regulator [Pseudogulbenkiania sp.]|nr:EAL domain-containing response regulator [Pseudogulbenkiania sp.]
MDKSTVRILVLDDEPFMLKLLARMLGNLGFSQVTICDSGRAALELLDAPDSWPDLILCDLNMPEMDGVQFVRQLVDRHYGGSLILVSGEDERVLQSVSKLAQAHQITVLGGLNKPVKPESLAELIAQWAPPRQVRPHQATRAYSAEELATAISHGDLVNYYQPKVAVTTGQVVGVETLVRWCHPQDGMVFPDQFIGIAEANGLIDELTRVVLVNAFRQARVWRDAGMALRVAINVSMDNLATLDFADFVTGQAAAAGVAPGEVVLEVTESRLMKDLRSPLETLTRLRLKRFGLSIDDFGTGYSSLAQLRDIPFDELKIDQSFVHGAWADETLRAMYDASLGLANQLGIDIVAEGVEDRHDWNFLRSTRCGFAQGYFIARPMPPAELPSWIEVWQGRVQSLLLAEPSSGERP